LKHCRILFARFIFRPLLVVTGLAPRRQSCCCCCCSSVSRHNQEFTTSGGVVDGVPVIIYHSKLGWHKVDCPPFMQIETVAAAPASIALLVGYMQENKRKRIEEAAAFYSQHPTGRALCHKSLEHGNTASCNPTTMPTNCECIVPNVKGSRM
jgi:hypothetical protein